MTHHLRVGYLSFELPYRSLLNISKRIGEFHQVVKVVILEALVAIYTVAPYIRELLPLDSVDSLI